MDDVGQLAGPFDRAGRSGFDDGPGNPARGPFFAITPQDIGNLCFIISVHHIRCGLARRCHPHIQRPVQTERKAAISLVKLGGTDTQIKHNAVNLFKFTAFDQLLDGGERPFKQAETAIKCAHHGLATCNRIWVAVNCGHTAGSG